MLRRLRKMGMLLLCAFVLALAVPAGTVRADSGIKGTNAFNHLEGDAKYLRDDYRDNYVLDIEETGVLEIHWEALNGIANALFAAIRTISYATVTLFYWALNFDIGEMFGGQINGIQQALKDTVFEPLLMLAIGACMATLLVKFAKRDAVGGIAEIGKILLVVVLSMFVVLKSDSALSLATNVTKEVSIDALSSVNDSMGMSGNREDFAAQAAGVLWVDLVHEPWKTVEFMNDDVDDGTVDSFLKVSDPEERAELVKGMGDAACFRMTVGFERIGFLIVYLIPCLAKCLLFIVVAGALLIFQVLAVFYLILAPVMLLLFLFAGYESILTAWLKKMLETQIMILVITFMLALLIRTDVFLFQKADEWGWFIVLLIQIIIGAGLFLNRGKIFELLSTVQRGSATPRYAVNRLRMSGNVKDLNHMRRNVMAAGRQIGRSTMALGRKAGIGAGESAPASSQGPVGASSGSAHEAGNASVSQGGQTPQARPAFRMIPGGAGQTGQQSGTSEQRKKHPVTAHPDPMMKDKLQQAGTAARKYVKNGEIGRHAGAATGAGAGMPAQVREYVKGAPIQFRYAAHTQSKRAKEKTTDHLYSAEKKAGAVRTAAGSEVERVKQGVALTAEKNAEGHRQSYGEHRKKREERAEKRSEYKSRIDGKREMLEQTFVRRREEQAQKRQARRFAAAGSAKEGDTRSGG
ncbi:hypothetical protein V1224_09325 [Lachnospiraceae bacterium JLR.KK008]